MQLNFNFIPHHYRHIYLILPLLLLITSCSSDSPSGQQGTRAISAIGYRAETKPFSINIRSTGELRSWEDVEIRTAVAGNVQRIHFEEGQFVNEGTLLVEIDSRTWEAQKRGLEAQLETARNELQRRESLLEIEGISQENVDQARVSVSDLEARIEELKVRIDLAKVRAPFAGRLGMRNFSPGAFLSQGEMITRLVQTQRLRIDFTIPARYAALAREGITVQVFSSSTGDTINASIYAIDPVIDANSRSLRLRGMLENDNRRFVPGDFVQVIMNVEQSEDAILIPSEAIISELNSQIVFVASNGTAKRTEIEIGTSTPGRVQILRGLQPGDTILMTGLMQVRDGSPVNITELNQEAGL